MSQFDKIRQSVPSLRNASDAEILRDIAGTTGYNDGDVAKVFGYGQTGGLTSNRIGAGIDNYQANMYGLGEAVTGAVGLDGVSKAMGRRRQDNEFQANVSSQRASELGGVDDWRDVDGIGSGLNYVGGLAAQSAPYLAESVVGGIAARGLMGGTRAALRGAQTVEAANAARKTLNVGSTIGGVAASYPSAVGDILSNQRDENGTTNLASAAVGGIPYAALNAVGVEGVVARGLRPLSQGGGDLLKRVAITGGTTALTEGTSESGQEGINQYFGRMAVNPEQTLFNEDANKRYVDSFVGGAALGGVIGGASGVRRPMDDGDLLKPPAAPPEEAPGAQGFTNPPSLTGTDPEALMGDPLGDQGGGMVALGLRPQLSGTQPSLTGTDPSALLGDPMAGGMLGRGNLLDNSADDARLAGLQGQFTSGEATAIDQELAAKAEQDRAAAERKQAIISEIEQVKQARIAQEQAEQTLAAERTTRAKEFGVTLKGKAQLETFGELEAALDAGTIDTKGFAQNMGLLGASKHGEVKKNLEAAAVLQRLVELRSTGVIGDAMFREAEQDLKDGKVKQVEKFIDGWNGQTAAANAETTTTKTTQPAANPGTAKTAAPAQPVAPAQQPASAPLMAPVQQPVTESPGALNPLGDIDPNKTVTVGKSADRMQTYTPQQWLNKLRSAPDAVKQRIALVTGLDLDGEPTGESSPWTMDEIAAVQGVTKQAVGGSLADLGITKEIIDRVAALAETDSQVTEAELGIDPEQGASGYRIEGSLSEAAGQGLIRDEVGSSSSVLERAASKRAQGQELSEKEQIALDKDQVLAEETEEFLAKSRAEKKQPRELYDPAKDETRIVREKAALAAMEKEVAAVERSAIGQIMAADWDNLAEGDTPKFASLPARAKMEWFSENDDIRRKVSDGKLEDIQSQITKDFGEGAYAPRPDAVSRATGADQQDSSGAGDTGSGAQSAGASPTAVDVPTSARAKLKAADQKVEAAGLTREELEWALATYERLGNTKAAAKTRELLGSPESAPKVDPAREAWDKERAAVPQMPAFDTLNERQQKQVADLVSREQFNLAAANTVAGDINQDVLGPDVPMNREVLESKSTAGAKGNSAPVSVEFEDIEATVSGADAVRDQLGELGIESALDLVRDWKLISDAKDPTEGEISHEYGAYAITLNAGGNMHPKKVGRTIRHELAHAMDMAPHGGIYSVQPDLRVRVINGRVFGVGPVAAEIVNLARRDRDIGAYLAYPLDLSRFGTELSQSQQISQTDRIQMELYAQMMALYTTDANVREWLADEAPATAKFLATTIKDFQNAPKRQIKKSEDATARRNAYAVQNSGGGGRRVPPAAGQNQSANGPGKSLKSIGTSPKQVGIPSLDRAPALVQNMLQSFKDGSSWVGIRTMFTEDLIALAAKAIPGGSVRAYKRAMDTIEVARGRMERDVVKVLQDFRTLPAHEQGKGPGSVNQLLMASTMEREWAFQPDWLTEKVAVNAALAERFNGLSAAGQALVQRVFKHGHETLQQMQDAVQANVASEYDTAIAEATAAGDKTKATKLTNKKAKELNDFSSMLDMRSAWPYAPLKRFGKHVVMGYSAAYAKAKADNDVKEMQRLQKDGDHYYVAFAETKAQARKMEADIKDSFLGGKTVFFEKLDQAEDFMGGRDVMGAFQRLRTVFNDGKVEGETETNERIDTMMRQMYLTLLSETSARKSEIHRRNVAGADGDMMRSFATQGRATAHFIAGLQTNGAVNKHLVDIKNEIRSNSGDREKQADLFNEIVRRHSMNLEYSPSGMIEKVMAGTSVWMLLTNPSYFLVNATQPFMMSAPLIGARYGYAKTNAEMFRAFKEVLPVIKDGKFTEDDYSALPQDTQRAIEELANRGVIDISLESVLGKFESAADSWGSKLDPVMQRMTGAAQAVESMNRLATAIAAYRLAKVEGGHDAAVEYAAKVIYETHGDYSGFNAPRFMRRGVGKLATQFRKFQLIQLSMFARLLNTAFKHADADERYIAKKALAFNLAHLGAAGGLMGMPAFSMIAWVIGKALPGDDEPDDPEATLRRLIGDKALADLLLKGAPKLLGVDISGRVGAGGMLSVLPYTDIALTREGYSSIVTGLLGPFVGGLAPKVVDGVGLIGQGQLWKGTEQLLPTGLANLMKATRFTTDGLTKRNGDVVLSADEVGVLDWAAQAVGLPTNVTTDRSFLANAQFKSDKFYRERTSQLKNKYAAAVRKNDTDTMREVREDWMQTQAARRKLGYEVQPLSTLLKAPQEQRKREAATTAGVQTNRSNQGFIVALQ